VWELQWVSPHRVRRSEVLLQVCWGGTFLHFLASTTIASASTKPKPYRWLTTTTHTDMHRDTDTQTHRHRDTDTQAHKHTCKDADTHARTHTQTHTHTHTHTHAHTHTQTHTHTHARTHTDTHTHQILTRCGCHRRQNYLNKTIWTYPDVIHAEIVFISVTNMGF